MSRQLQLRAAAAAFTLLATSCSLVVDVALPKEGDDTDCAFLNRSRAAGVTDCVRWQFNPVTLACELGPLDEDNDGFYPAVCMEPDGPSPAAQVDCNDDIALGGATAFPGAPELCDGNDNDCDGLVDEGVLVATLSDGPTMTFSRDPDDLAFAVDSVAANTVGVAFSVRDPTAVPGVSVRARDLRSTVADRFSVITADANSATAVAEEPSAIVSAGIGIAPLGGNAYAVAFINSSGGQRRLIAGVATAERAKTLHVETSIFTDGLACTANDGDCSVTRPAVDRPTIGVSGTDVLVTTVRRSTTTAACDASATEVNVVGNALTRRDFSNVTLPANGGRGAFPALRTTTVANPLGLDIGVMRSDASPAVIGLDTGGFVVALPQLNNTILLRTITVTAGVFAVDESRDLSLRLGANDLALLEPSLALSTHVDADGDLTTPETRQTLAISFTRGCGGATTVVVRLLDVAPTAGLLTSAGGGPIEVDGEGLADSISEGRSSISFAADQRNSWFITFAKRRGWRGRVLSFDGTRHGGAESYDLTEGSAGISLTPVAFGMPAATSDSPRFGGMFVATVDGMTGLFTSHLSCPAATD